MDPSSLYRKTAIDKVASPEQLDVMIEVTPPRGSLAMYTVAGLALGGALWGVFGSMPERVDGRGILQRGQLRQITAAGSGVLMDLDLLPGQEVTTGQVVGQVEQADFDSEVETTAAELRAAQERYDFTRRSNQARISDNNRTVGDIDSRIATGQQRLATEQENLARAQDMFDRQLLNQQQLDAAQQAVERARRTLESDRSQKRQIEAENTRLRSEINTSRQNVDQLQARLDELRSGGEAGSTVTSTIDGSVVDILKSVGDRVRFGEPIATLEAAGDEMVAVSLVPTAPGAAIGGEMEAQVVPTNIKRERYGYIVGEVESRGNFAIQPNEAIERFGESVRDTVSDGAAYEVRVTLEKADTPTGFQWSSGDGPPDQILTGTEFSVTIITDRRPPYTYLMPYIRRMIFGDG